MANDLTHRGPQDPARVNVAEPRELRWWCAKFKCSEAQLRAAVNNVGVMTSDVEAELKMAGWTSDPRFGMNSVAGSARVPTQGIAGLVSPLGDNHGRRSEKPRG